MAFVKTSFPAAFLDRDGVLNKDIGYPYRLEDLHLIDGAIDAISWLNRQGLLCVVITNQSGVARGYFEEEDVHRFHAEMRRRFAAEGAEIAAFYHCPYHPEASVEAYRLDHPDRKPRPGMIERAICDLHLTRTGSFVIGDRPTDLEAASAAGLPGFLFTGGNLKDFVTALPIQTTV